MHKFILVAIDDDECMKAASSLEDHDIEATCITTNHIDDERPLYSVKLRHFRLGLVRSLCIPFNVWLRLKDELEYYLINNDMFVLWKLDYEFIRICVNWLSDAQRRGFRLTENFLIHTIEQDDDPFFTTRIEDS